MAIYDQVNEQMKEAMRNKEKARLTGLRGIRAAFIEEMKKDGSDAVSDDAAVQILRRLAKQRKDSIESYSSAGRDDLVAQEQVELDVIGSFLPSLADEATTREWVQAAIADSGAASMAQLGMVMGALMKAHKGQVDGTLANKIARELLQ